MTEEEALKERQLYVQAFNNTMVKIWKERITLLDAIDTGTLLRSVVEVSMNADGKYLNIHLSQAFRAYGLFVDAGTGKEVSRGNKGDIGRNKTRQKKPWFAKKYFASVMNLRDFFSENTAEGFLGIVSDAFNTKGIAGRYR